MSTPPTNDLFRRRITKLTFPILLGFLIAGTLVCNHWFISPSQTAFFLYTLFASLLIGMCGIMVFIQPKITSLKLPAPVLPFVLFALYVLVHGLFTGTGINSIHIYLIISCLLFIACLLLPAPVLQEGTFKIIAVAAAIEALICILQYAGILPSQNIFFRITGTWINPNVTAVFLAMSVPVLLYSLFYGHPVYKQIARLVTLLVLTALIFLKCRTAWFGALTATFLMLNHQYQLWQYFKKQGNLLVKSLLVLTVMAALIFIAIYAYRFKQHSADGRMLVWKLCVQMIKQKPITGFGYGSFEQAYNVHQATWFKSGYGTMQEKYQADYVRIAYNELLQNAVEGGILGLLLFIWMMVPLLIPPANNSSRTNTVNKPPQSKIIIAVYAGVVAYVVMSLVNFTIQAIPGLCLFIIYAAVLLRVKPVRQYHFNRNVAGSLLIITGLYFFITQTLTTSAQWQNHKAAVAVKRMHYQKAGRLLQSLSDRLSTSDSYWQNYGQLLLEQKRYLAAAAMFNKAKVFTSSPDVYLKTGYCYEQTGQIANAEKEFDMAASMVPNRLTPRYALLQLYLKTNDTAAALKQAKEMIAIHEKTPSAKANQFKKEADSIIRTLTAPLNNITQSQIQ